MRKTINLPSLSNVSLSSTATLEVPVGPTYDRIIFTVGGTAPVVGDIDGISILIDGKLVQKYKNAQRLFDMNSFYSRGADAIGMFALHFMRAELMDNIYRKLPGIGTADVQTFQIQLELNAGFPADGTITAHAEIDPMPQPLGAFMKVRDYAFSSAVAGEMEIDKLPKGAYYSAIHLFKADVSEVEVEADQVLIVRATKGILERVQKEASPTKRVPVTASATHIDFCTDGDLANSIRTQGVQDFRIRATIDTSGSMDVVCETIDVLSQAT